MAVKKTLDELAADVAVLTQRLAVLETDHAALRAEIAQRRAEDRIGKLEAYVGSNDNRITTMEARYDAVVEEVKGVAANLTNAVSDLRATDEASGWKKWKEQNPDVAR